MSRQPRATGQGRAGGGILRERVALLEHDGDVGRDDEGEQAAALAGQFMARAQAAGPFVKILPATRTSPVKRDHFSRIDTDRTARGATPLTETLTAILHEHESQTGVADRIVELQEQLREALDREHRQLLLDLEAAHVERLMSAEEIVFNVAFEMGLAHHGAQALRSPTARELAVEVGEVVATSEAEVHEIVVALAAVMAGFMAPYDA